MEQRTHGQLSFTPDGHPCDTLVPTLDDLTGTQSEVERSAGGVGIELLAVQQLADVPTNDVPTVSVFNTAMIEEEAGRPTSFHIACPSWRRHRPRS